MNFNKNDPHYLAWCLGMGVSPNDMPQVVWPRIFECLLRGMARKEMDAAIDRVPAVVLEVVESAKMDLNLQTDEELRKYITDNGGVFHHFNKREKLLEIARTL